MKSKTIKELEEGVITIDDYVEENMKDEDEYIYPYISIKTLLKEAYEDGAILELEEEQQKLSFVDNRLNAILGKGEDYGFDEYDLK